MPIISGRALIPVPPPPTPIPGTTYEVRTGLRFTWTGWDGSVFDLGKSSEGTMLVRGGLRGLTMPPITRFTSQSPGVAGSRYRGSRVESREVFWPIYVWSDGTTQDWIDVDRAFWKTFRPDAKGTWTVTQPGGEERYLDLRFTEADDSFDIDPAMLGWNIYGITLVADQPFWRGIAETRTFAAATPVPFFGPPGLFNITSGTALATASINNDGDVPAWITWTVTGPFDAASVGIGTAQIPVPALAAGQTLTIWTQPDQMIALDNDGVEVVLPATAKFAAVNPGKDRTLTLSMTASNPGGSIQASLTPYYYRAF